MRYLIRARVQYDLPTNTFTLNSDKGGTRVFRGDREAFIKFLMKIKAKDNESDPRSNRKKTYADIADEIISGTDPYIYVWSNTWPDAKFKAINGG